MQKRHSKGHWHSGAQRGHRPQCYRQTHATAARAGDRDLSESTTRIVSGTNQRPHLRSHLPSAKRPNVFCSSGTAALQGKASVFPSQRVGEDKRFLGATVAVPWGDAGAQRLGAAVGSGRALREGNPAPAQPANPSADVGTSREQIRREMRS